MDDIPVPPGAEKFIRARRFEPNDVNDCCRYETPGKASSSARGMELEWFDDAADAALSEPDEPMIEGLLDDGGLSDVHGGSNTGKTFVALNIAFHVASGRSWNGKKVKAGLVIYIAAEGGTRIRRRLAALKQKYSSEEIVPRPLFALIRYPIDLRTNDVDLKELISLIRAAEAKTGEKCTWLIVDTLSRAMAGGDENSSVDMGRMVAAADRIRAEIGAHVSYVHHTGKDAARGARGHSLLRAATDTEIEITPNAITVTKQRDMEGGYSIGFRLVDLQIGTDAEGKPIKSAVVEWDEEGGLGRDDVRASQKSFPPPLRLLIEVVDQAILESGQSIRPFSDGPLVKAASDPAVRDRYFARLAERDDDTPRKRAGRQRKSFNRAVKSAIDRKLLLAADWKNERWLWPPP